ncbi:hypothetical protein SCP_0410590 [Sparassis crispa]|uniref:MULE transposase domain-containing protein n=1 Tax=Sparassis crispa TaxID=139825 RepID=A0A401GKK8_9APHY|nr:hypothetical protein SCP_0410590 [Sparassis crispa]GBE82674.1 hypothetical protein SCP_0410590 [Sparassis crispa]
MLRSPCLPLHPDLHDYAMSLLRRREPIRLVRSKCLSWAKEHWQEQQGDGSHRFHLTPYDSSSLYRTAARERGIPQRSSAADNLDCWFHSEDPRPPSPLFTSSCLHYQPYLEGIFERFEIIISTPQQRDAAWTFGYKKQIIMDGTFRICSARVLCFIIMVINDQNKGIPVAHIVFSAKKHTKAVHADYNGALLTRLVEKFKIGMGVNPLGDTFCAAVAMTDNDPRERLALETTWEDILCILCLFHTWEDILCILCLFHTWQAWQNSLNKFMRGVPKGDPAKAVRSRLGAFLMRLLKVITNYTEAIAAFNTELQYFRMLGEKNDDEARWQSKVALAFLAYLQDYLKTRSFWKAWSRAGVIEAAARMGVLETQVARTSNHLESYNDKMKNIHFEPSKHSGRLPRIDVWIAVLITDVIPKFFENLHEARELADYRDKMRTLPVDKLHQGTRQTIATTHNTAVACPVSATSPTECQAKSPSLPSPPSFTPVERRMLEEFIEDPEIPEPGDNAKELMGDSPDAIEKIPGFRQALKICDDGSTSASCLSEDATHESADCAFVSWTDMEIALDSSAIIADLTDITLDFPFTCAQSEFAGSTPDSQMSSPSSVLARLSDSDSDSKFGDASLREEIQNKVAMITAFEKVDAEDGDNVTAMQEVLQATDLLTSALRRIARKSATALSRYDEFISPRMHAKLTGATSHRVVLLQVVPPFSTQPLTRGKTSVSPFILLPPLSPSLHPGDKCHIAVPELESQDQEHRLVPFERQLHEKRKPSYSWR